jgi:hypothetical protein
VQAVSGLAFAAATGAAARFGFEAVLEDFPVERTAADVEDAGRLFLVSVHGLENADDVRPLRFRQ